MDQKVAIVTGASRGIGLEVVRQLAKQGITVILTCRDSQKGEQVVNQLSQEGINAYFHPLDVASNESCEQFSQALQQSIKRVDILINNAGIFLEGNDPSLSILDLPHENFLNTLETNTFGAIRLVKALRPIFSADGQIINVSSTMGQLEKMDSGYAAYRMSKAALNVVTKVLADELKENTDICVNSVHPGWIKTQMGGPNAPQSVQEGADTIVWLALGADGTNPTGKFFHNRQIIPW